MAVRLAVLHPRRVNPFKLDDALMLRLWVRAAPHGRSKVDKARESLRTALESAADRSRDAYLNATSRRSSIATASDAVLSLAKMARMPSCREG